MNDFARYSRQVVLREVGVNGQAALRDSTVLILGLGGLGTIASLYLAGAGIGRLLLSDLDSVAPSNLQRQILYRQSDLGRSKLDAACAQLQALNPDCETRALPGPLDDAALRASAARADVLLDCSDNFATRFALNRASVHARKPLVSGAAIRMEGQLAVFHAGRGGACYACLYPQAGEAQERCEEAGILGPVTGVIGSLQALATIQLLLGLEAGVGRLLLWNALTGEQRRLTIQRDPACVVCGVPHE